ncbi:hypothetical protein EXD82_06735 [Peptacetobacter hominis]|uniref:Uncharacterized protein n=1 Tax=Peptacetobacter hominis TaxID=2743610 RepID=A0A544QUY1_9FIRM|nr:hypothetical protein [Peptacetobacter hominis]TQQ84495.1 hypothetical protein EXD82_06735 [Peptacetobacter hominis]
MKDSVWNGKYRFIELGDSEVVDNCHEVDLDKLIFENMNFEEGEEYIIPDESESSILNDFASGTGFTDIDDEADIDTQYLELSADLDDFDEDDSLIIDEDIESIIADI